MDFPTQLDQATQQLHSESLDEQSRQDIAALAAKGYEIQLGLTEAYAEAIAKLCLEPSIKEYCPNDSGRRFSSLDATKEWLSRGRAAFLLLKRDDSGEMKLVGYGWSGAASSSQVPGGQTTFAIRIGEAGQGQGLATPFARSIVNATKVLFSADNFWLETWQSNGGAVHIYHKIGFTDVASSPDQRPGAEGQVPDTRLYMELKS